MVMPWFRKNKRILMVVLVGFLMFSWGILPALRHFATDRVSGYGEILDRSVTPQMFDSAAHELDLLHRSGLMQYNPLLQRYIFSPEMEGEDEEFAPRISTEAIWRYLVLTFKVDEADIHVFQTQVNEIMEQFPQHMRDRTTYNAVNNWMGIVQLTELKQGSYEARQPQLWMEYAYEKHEVDMEYVKIDPDIFIDGIEVDDDQVYEFYEERKDQYPEPEAGVFGYLAPERVKFEYAYPDLEAIEAEITVTEDEIKDYYEEHKEDYIIEEEEEKEKEKEKENDETENLDGIEPEADIDADQDHLQEQEQNHDDGEELKENEPENGDMQEDIPDDNDEAEAADEIDAEYPDPNDEQTDRKNDKEEEIQYKPLDEVRDDIKEIITAQKVEENAQQSVEAALEELDSIFVQPGNPFPLQQVAGRHGLIYELAQTDDGTEQLCRETVEQDITDGPEIASLLFDERLDAGFPETVDNAEKPLIIQLLERFEPAPEPFETVEKEVRKDLAAHLSLGKATEFAEYLKQLAGEKGLENAVREADERLAGEFGKVQGEENDGETDDEDSTDENDSEGTEKEENDEETLHYLVHESAGLVSLDRPVIDGARRENIVEKALEMAEGELAVIKDTYQPPASFVVKKLQGKSASPENFEMWKQQREQRDWQKQFQVMIAAMQGQDISLEDFSDSQSALWQWLLSLREDFPLPSQLR